LKKGLLILVGGRTVTNILVAQHLRPDVIVPIASQESLKPGEAWSQIETVLRKICPTGLRDPIPVNGFNIDQVKAACQKTVNDYSETDWVFNLTPATKIMSFGAYEIARGIGASAWYLDSDSSQTIALCGKAPEGSLYKLCVEDYLASYGRTITAFGQVPDPRRTDLACKLALKPEDAMKFRDTLRNSGFNQVKRHQTKQGRLTSQAKYIAEMCEFSYKASLLDKWNNISGGAIEISVDGCDLWQFFDGLWLEIYAYEAAKQAGCFEDVRYGLTTPGEHGENQIDLLATRNGVMWIAECKTEKEFQVEHLDKLTAIASLIGDDYVGRLFISSKTIPEGDSNLAKSFSDFCEQARARRIVVVKGDDLKNLPEILKHQALKPTYARG